MVWTCACLQKFHGHTHNSLERPRFYPVHLPQVKGPMLEQVREGGWGILQLWLWETWRRKVSCFSVPLSASCWSGDCGGGQGMFPTDGTWREAITG